MGIDVDWLRGSLQTILLQVIAPLPTYGYEICKRLRQRSSGVLELNEGSLYPALHKLEHANLLSSRWELAADGRRRKYYAITPGGLEQLQQKREQWREFRTVMEGLLGEGDVQPA
ncbi:MAG: helix-turn-helix transcriptional regulator [Planctomycetota bacterium]